MSFGTQHYTQTNHVFNKSELKVYISIDGNKWINIDEYTFLGGTIGERWNMAIASFSVPEGTQKLSVCIETNVGLAYRIDDLKLEASSDEYDLVDFTNAVEMIF